MFTLILPLLTLAQSAPLVEYHNPLADRAARAVKRALPSRQTALRTPARYAMPAWTPQESARLREPSARQRTGLHRPLKIALDQAGAWEPNGTWRLAIHAAEAESLRVHVEDFHAGQGALWIHDGTGADAQISGPFTTDGPWHDGSFWSDTIVGDTLILEYQPARAGDRQLPFRLAELAQGVRWWAAKAGTPGAAASCNLDVSCYAEWATTARAVGRYTFESDGSTYLCSGTLMNVPGTLSTPYFLTADHCISSNTEARTVNVFWFYQTPSCRGAVPNPRDLPRTNGATYVVGTGRPGGDVTLLRLPSVPSGVTFAGWTAEPPAPGTRVTGIHHPSGDYKRISIGTLRNASTRDAQSYWGAYWDGGGLTEGGSSGSGLFLDDGRLIGTLSHGPKYDSAAEYCAALPFADNYGRLSAFYSLLRPYLEPGSGGTPPATGGGSNSLVSGTPVPFRVGPVSSATLFGGTSVYQVTVPAGATRLDVRLNTTTPNTDVDLHVRYNTAPAVNANGRIDSDHSSTSDGGAESVSVTAGSTPALRPGTYYIALALFTTNVAAEGTLTATVTTDAPPPATGGSAAVALTSGVARNISIAAQTGAVLLTGASSYRIDVPAGAQRLDVKLSTPGRADVDLDLYARFGQAVTLAGGRPQFDHGSEGPAGEESLTITPNSTPTLRAGTYYLHLGVFTTGQPVDAVLTATVTLAATELPNAGGPLLTSGEPRNYSLSPVASPRLFAGESGYRIVVPEGATRLDVRLATPNPTVDVDLYVRAGTDVAVVNGRVVADASSRGNDGNELVTISGMALRPGVYYIGLALFTPEVAVNGTITATVTTAAASESPLLTSGVPARFRIGPVEGATLYAGVAGFRVNVPEGASRLEIRLVTETPDADVDLYARHATDATIEDGRVVVDHRSDGLTGNETIVITPASTPALRAGTYFIALGLFTNNVTAVGAVTATVTTLEAPTQSTGSALTSGVPVKFTFGPVTQPTLFSGANSYRLTVPEGVTRLEVRMTSETPSVDTDLYVRRDADVALEDGNVVADFESTSVLGHELIIIEGAALRPATYYISAALFTRNAVARGSLVATVFRGVGASAPEELKLAPEELPLTKRLLKKAVEAREQ